MSIDCSTGIIKYNTSAIAYIKGVGGKVGPVLPVPPDADVHDIAPSKGKV